MPAQLLEYAQQRRGGTGSTLSRELFPIPRPYARRSYRYKSMGSACWPDHERARVGRFRLGLRRVPGRFAVGLGSVWVRIRIASRQLPGKNMRNPLDKPARCGRLVWTNRVDSQAFWRACQ